MIEEVGNPWRNRKDVMIIDIETNFDEDWSEHGKRNRIFRCGVAYSYNDEKYYSIKDPKEFVSLVSKSKILVTYNGEGFDFLVLEKYGFKIKKYEK
jgi:uncharacterized protein YprB with RNaseH-like and TPR domain